MPAPRWDEDLNQDNYSVNNHRPADRAPDIVTQNNETEFDALYNTTSSNTQQNATASIIQNKTYWIIGAAALIFIILMYFLLKK